jgi:hypothetical protein
MSETSFHHRRTAAALQYRFKDKEPFNRGLARRDTYEQDSERLGCELRRRSRQLEQ